MEEKKLLNEINKNLKMMGIPIMEDINVNAQSLKSHLDNLGYDYSKSLDNAGDLDEDFTGYVKKVFKELNDKLPEYKQKHCIRDKIRGTNKKYRNILKGYELISDHNINNKVENVEEDEDFEEYDDLE